MSNKLEKLINRLYKNNKKVNKMNDKRKIFFFNKLFSKYLNVSLDKDVCKLKK